MVSIFLWLLREYLPSFEMFRQKSPSRIFSSKLQSEIAVYSSRISQATESAVMEAINSFALVL